MRADEQVKPTINPVVKAMELADTQPKGSFGLTLPQDPVTQTLMWAAAMVVLAISVGKPIKDYLRGEKREDKKDKVEDAKANAESIMYEQLAAQVVQYRTIADSAYKERNDLIQRVGVLEAKTETLAEQKQLVERLKEILDRKDEEIRKLMVQSNEDRQQFLAILNAKDIEIAKRDDRILMLERGLRDLEIRLADEERITQTFICPLEERRRRTTKKVVSDGAESSDVT